MAIRNKALVAGIILIILLATAISGCITSDDNEEGSPADNMNENELIQAVTTVYSENDSRSTAYGIIGDTIIIELPENPTTGYSWNMSYSEGLELKNDSYNENISSEEIVGAGGIHQWTFELTENGEQSISAVYIRPWENKTGTEDVFSMNVVVLAENELIKNSGTVTFLELEGGFYGIVTADEMRYDPVNLADEFKKGGMQVEFTAYPRNDMMSFHMWGQLIEIRTIKEIND